MSRRLVVVTGSRRWTAAEPVRRLVGDLPADAYLMHGAAPGLDTIAARAAEACSLRVLPEPADWSIGKSAGSRRNQRMVDRATVAQGIGFDVEVWAFPLPDSIGTYDCMRRARANGLRVRIFDVTGEEVTP